MNPSTLGPRAVLAALACAALGCVALAPAGGDPPRPLPPRHLEKLGRGLVALPTGGGTVFLSWRLLGTDPDGVAFHVYRRHGDADPVRLTPAPLAAATCFTDPAADPSKPARYTVRPVVGGVEQAPCPPAVVPAGAPPRTGLAVPLQTPPGCTPNDCSPGDLDGDGEYDLVVKMEERPRDNSQRGRTGRTRLEAYTLAGVRLWSIDLGINVREGAHYTQFLVYDFDGDGRAEVLCKTADGTRDGAGTVIGDAAADHRNADGYVLTGPEFLAVFDGRTGEALATTDYLPGRGDVAAWGDEYGNRADRFLACVAYLDGERPSAVFCRGYYTRAALVAWDWRGGTLTKRWAFDTDDGTPGNRQYRGQGDHSVSAADVDHDGKDDIVYGAMTVSSQGKGMYTTGLGHGDALHVGDFDPGRPGLEVFNIHERKPPAGVSFRDARTGAVIWSKPSPDVPRGVVMDIDPRHPGCESWALGDGLSGVWDVAGRKVSDRRPRPCSFGVWWDGDRLRELLDRTRVTKWDPQTERETVLFAAGGCATNNGSKGDPALSADILGDWREEVIWRSADGRTLHVHTTTTPTDVRLPTLMHDAQYRCGVAGQNVGYNQPPHPSYFLGHGMAAPPRARVVVP